MGDQKNGVVVHAWDEGHTVDWKGVKHMYGQNYWKRRVLVAIWIKENSNLDCELILNLTWISYTD